MIKRLLTIALSFLLTSSLAFAGTSQMPNGLVIGTLSDVSSADTTPGDDDLYVVGTMEVDGAVDLDGELAIEDGLTVTEDVTITHDAADEEFTMTNSSESMTMMTLYCSDTDLAADTVLLSLDLKDNGDANGIFLQCRDNTYANTVLSVGADGAVTIDASGGGSGTVLSEATMVVNDAEFNWDSETQDLAIGDGTNQFKFSDNGAMDNDGSATLTLENGDDLVISATPEAGPFLSASSNDTAAGVITFTPGIDIDEDVDIDFNASDEEISVVNSAAYGADGAMLTLNDTNATPAATAYLLRARYTVNADTNARFAVFEDNNGDDMLVIDYNGSLIMENGDAITNSTDDEITLDSNDEEDITFDLNTATDNEVLIKSGSGVTQLDIQIDTLLTDTVEIDTLLNVDEDVDIDLDANDEEVQITQSASACDAVIMENTAATILSATTILDLKYTVDSDTDTKYLTCNDNSGANEVMSIGADGAITIDVSGGGSGTVLSEATLVANDAAFRIDSETQDLEVGDASNKWVFTDNGALSNTGTGSTLTIANNTLVQTSEPNSQSIYTLVISTDLADTEEYAVSNASGKAGFFDVWMGTHACRGVFTSAGVPTLATDMDSSCSTSDNNDATVEVYMNINQIAQRMQPACLNESDCEGDLPVKDCNNTFIIIQESNITSIEQEGGCVFISAPQEELVATTDEFLFKILGIEG